MFKISVGPAARTGARMSLRAASGLVATAFLSILAACSPITNDGPGSLDPVGNQGSQQRALSPNPNGEVLGNGNVRISLLVPLTIPGGAANVAKELRNGAAMAIEDFGQQQVQLVVKDTKGRAAEAQAAASEAAREGTSLILGPLFAANVSAASGVTQPSGIPILAFSTDTSVARRGVYLFSYTPQSDTQRIISYAASQGRRSVYAFLPQNAEGSLREQVLREEAGRNGMQVNVVKYAVSREGVSQAVQGSIAGVQASDTIYIPDGGAIPAAILTELQQSGVTLAGKQVLGSGKWESVRKGDAVLQNALYPGRDVRRFNQFANRYQGKYGGAAGVNAALAYDAVTFAVELVRLHGNNAFTSRNIESSRGFQGTNGLFRVQSSGITQRGLAIYRVQGGQGVLAEPAISSFGRNS